jgi:predicted nucleotidyltransferase
MSGPPVPHEPIAEFCRRWRVAELSLLDSIPRGDPGADRDVEVLVSFAPGARWTLWDILSMQDELAALLGRKADLVERRLVETSKNWIRRRRMLEEAGPIYVAG